MPLVTLKLGVIANCILNVVESGTYHLNYTEFYIDITCVQSGESKF